MAQAKKSGDRIEGLTLNLPNAQKPRVALYALRNAATRRHGKNHAEFPPTGHGGAKGPSMRPRGAEHAVAPDAQTQSVIIDNLTKDQRCDETLWDGTWQARSGPDEYCHHKICGAGGWRLRAREAN